MCQPLVKLEKLRWLFYTSLKKKKKLFPGVMQGGLFMGVAPSSGHHLTVPLQWDCQVVVS